MQGSLFSRLAHRLRTLDGPVYPLHVGDTYLEPVEGCRMQDLDVATHPGMHRYAPPHGLPALLEVVVDRAARRTGVATTPDNVLIAAGATGALGAAIGATIDPGDEVLLLAPYWPLITGIVKSFSGEPVPVPFVGEVESAADVERVLDAHRGPRTAALYLSTPNNPTGKVIPGEWIEAATLWARRHGLWVYADEVYEDYVYRGEHAYGRTVAPERTFSVHSFSKAFGMAGNRCGYVVGPAEVMGELRKVSTHTFYSTPTASQLAAARALDGRGDAWIADVSQRYLEVGEAAAARLGLAPPEGSQFLWIDVADVLDGRGLMGFLEDALDRGLLLAPGPSFGPYPTHVRACYTCAAPEVVTTGIEHLARSIGR